MSKVVARVGGSRQGLRAQHGSVRALQGKHTPYARARSGHGVGVALQRSPLARPRSLGITLACRQ